ncbi:MAG: DNA/RNA nuclease SfsA [Eubacteriales bacterium]|nr:DNA/RNA nuclease SfsA [Eubacteriales bacterium]
MQYKNIVKAKFVSRPNRFIAKVLLSDGTEETVHVKNTGRCRELLLPGAEVYLEKAENPNRKTGYDLIGVHKPSLGVVNIDSMAPNAVCGEWLQTQGFDLIRPEYTFGRSRIDFYMEKNGEKYLCEVKGCTLEIDGIGYFPDAPTERGIKHLQELAAASEQGYRCMLTYVIPMEGVTEVRPNMETHPAYGEALERAKQKGVDVVFLPCRVTADSVTADPGAGRKV